MLSHKGFSLNTEQPYIESLVKALGGEIKEGRGSRCKFILNMSVACFHRPHPSPDTDKGAVESVRDWLLSIGVKP